MMRSPGFISLTRGIMMLRLAGLLLLIVQLMVQGTLLDGTGTLIVMAIRLFISIRAVILSGPLSA